MTGTGTLFGFRVSSIGSAAATGTMISVSLARLFLGSRTVTVGGAAEVVVEAATLSSLACFLPLFVVVGSAAALSPDDFAARFPLLPPELSLLVFVLDPLPC